MARKTQQMFRQDNKANNNRIQPILQEIHDALYEVIKHHQSQSIITNRASTAKPVNGMERDKKTKKETKRRTDQKPIPLITSKCH